MGIEGKHPDDTLVSDCTPGLADQLGVSEMNSVKITDCDGRLA